MHISEEEEFVKFLNLDYVRLRKICAFEEFRGTRGMLVVSEQILRRKGYKFRWKNVQ